MCIENLRSDILWRVIVLVLCILFGGYRLASHASLATTVEGSGLIAFQLKNNGRVEAGFDSGVCSLHTYQEVRKYIADRQQNAYFVGVPGKNGQRYDEYVNLLYIDYFDAYIENGKTYYVARFYVRSADCGYLRALERCGSDLINPHTYQKWVSRLVELGLGTRDKYQPRKTYRLEDYHC